MPERAASVETYTVAYQDMWVDFNIDLDHPGTYTPAQLRAAGLVVRQGKTRRYALVWPGGTPQPPAPAPRVPQTRRMRKAFP